MSIRSLKHPALRWLVPLGRLLFSLIFVSSGLTHFSQQTIGYAASQGVPFASFFAYAP